MIIMGIDASTTATGVSVFDFESKKLIFYTTIIPNGKLEWHERLIEQGKELNKIIKAYSPEKVFMEDVPLKKQGGIKTSVMLGAVQGFFLGVFSLYNMSVEYIQPGAWRSKAGLFTGKALDSKREKMKEHAIELANKKFGLDLKWFGPNSKRSQDDVAEAILIGAVMIGAFKKSFR